MASKRTLILSGITLVAGSLQAAAQQPLPRPIVLYRPVQNTTQYPAPNQPVQTYRGTTVSTQAFDRQPTNYSLKPFGPAVINTNSANFAGAAVATPNPATAGTTNGIANQGIQQASQNGQPNQTDNQGQTSQQQGTAEQESRPTLQQLQNPSGAMNLTHNGFTNGQQIAPNTYLGPQFQNWQNQQAVNQMPASFGGLDRMQPGQFGGYTGPNTYLGPANNSWTNMSQGGIAPGLTGSYDFSIWP